MQLVLDHDVPCIKSVGVDGVERRRIVAQSA
jgi:hypothetical protein